MHGHVEKKDMLTRSFANVFVWIVFCRAQLLTKIFQFILLAFLDLGAIIAWWLLEKVTTDEVDDEK